VKALVAMPVATPWMTRAAMIQPMPGAIMNTTMAASSTASEPTSTGRRPRWSDSEPATRSAARSASVYTAKAMVSIPAGKPH
jgi:hypothetical protein